MTKLEKLAKEIERAEAAFLVELKRAYPIGTTVTYRLRGGKDAHKYPWQEGRVIGYAQDARRLRVELAQSRGAKQTGIERLYVTSLPISKVRKA